MITDSREWLLAFVQSGLATSAPRTCIDCSRPICGRGRKRCHKCFNEHRKTYPSVVAVGTRAAASDDGFSIEEEVGVR